MAKIKACYPLFGKANSNHILDSLTVDAPIVMGKMVERSVKPNFAEGTLYADDEVAESAKEFKDADVSLTLDELSEEAYNEMFNPETKTVGTTNTAIDLADSDSSCGAYCDIYGTIKNGIKRYIVTLLHRVKFDIPEDKTTTKGENITFETTPLTGKAYADKNGQWRTRAYGFTTLEAAKEFAKKLVKREPDTLYSESLGGDGDIIVDEAVNVFVTVLPAEAVDNEGEHAAAIKANQAAVTVVKTENTAAASGSLASMQSYERGGAEGKYFALVIETGESSVVGVTVNGTALTQADADAASALNVPGGSFVVWVDALTAPAEYTIGIADKLPQTLTVNFTDNN